jgi:hypothetical protein
MNIVMPQPKLIGDFKGYGYGSRGLSIREQEKHLAGYYLFSITNYSAKFEEILPNIFQLDRKKEFWRVVEGAGWPLSQELTIPVGIH